ncbi:MAG: T9SS type A sorting domain-containing protein [Bacteroidia bacterium]
MEKQLAFVFHAEKSILSLTGDLAAITRIEIFNHLGKSVDSPPGLAKGELDLSSLPDGLYNIDIFNKSDTMLISAKVYKDSTHFSI